MYAVAKRSAARRLMGGGQGRRWYLIFICQRRPIIGYGPEPEVEGEGPDEEGDEENV